MQEQRGIESLSVVELKAAIFDRQQAMQQGQREIEMLAEALSKKIEAEKGPTLVEAPPVPEAE